MLIKNLLYRLNFTMSKAYFTRKNQVSEDATSFLGEPPIYYIPLDAKAEHVIPACLKRESTRAYKGGFSPKSRGNDMGGERLQTKLCSGLLKTKLCFGLLIPIDVKKNIWGLVQLLWLFCWLENGLNPKTLS